PTFWAVTLNTVYWAVGSTILAFLIGLGAALVIQREFVGRSLVRGLLMIPYVISYVAAAYVWRWLYHSDYGLSAACCSTGMSSTRRSTSWIRPAWSCRR